MQVKLRVPYSKLQCIFIKGLSVTNNSLTKFSIKKTNKNSDKRGQTPLKVRLRLESRWMDKHQKNGFTL